jgi:hypothetical protein
MFFCNCWLQFEQVSSGLTPDDVTFLCAIAGCDQAGLFEEGWLVIELMSASRELDPDGRHITCMDNTIPKHGVHFYRIARHHFFNYH